MSNMGFPAEGEVNRGWQLYLTSLIMVIVAGLFVIARCGTRWHFRQFGSDDYTIIVSMAFSIFLSVAIQLAIVHGYGQKKDDLTDDQLSSALRLFFIAQTPYKITVCLNKISVVLLYTRIFVPRAFRITCWVVIGILTAWSVGAIFATILQCVPVEGSWRNDVDATCIDKSKFWIAYAAGNVATDVLVLALPIPIIMRLQLKLRDRLMVCSVFLLGGFVTICSILRTTAVSNSVENKTDITYNFIPRGIWTLVEANLGIICACLPVLKQPLSLAFPRLFGSTTRARATGYSGSAAMPHSANQYPLRSAGSAFDGAGGASRTTEIRAGKRRGSDEEGIMGPESEGRSDSEADQVSVERRNVVKKQTMVSVRNDAAGSNY